LARDVSRDCGRSNRPGRYRDQRIDSYVGLTAETAAWQKRRNAERARIKWMFTTEKPGPKPAALKE
jgi:hypothetical protein